jgi:hypothetical protein
MNFYLKAGGTGMRLRSWLAVAGALTVGISGAMGVVALNASAATTTMIEDTNSVVTWTGTWSACSGNCNKASDNSFRWTSTVNSAVTVPFTGSQISLFGNKEPWANIATVSIDGGAAVDVDFYSATATATTVQVYSSPTLSEGSHSLKLTMTSRRNPASSGGNAITFDKAVVTSGGTGNPSPSTSSPPPSGTYLSGLPWNSGVNPQSQTAERVTQFQNFRAATVDNITLFPPRDNWSTVSDPAWMAAGLPAGFNAAKQDLVMTVPLWPGSNSVGNTGTQAQWQTLANNIKAKDANAYVRLGWEMNLPNWYFNLNSGNRSQWQAAFIQAVQWMKAVAPQLRIVWNPNKGADQTSGCNASNPCSRQVFQAVKSYVDVYGIDSYDSWPPDNTAANRNVHLNDLLGESLAYAKANGKKFAVPEWGVACNTSGCQWAGNAGGDNPQYITDYLGFFNSHAADLAFESYFDEPDVYIRSALSVTPIGPNAPAKYKQLIAQYRVS